MKKDAKESKAKEAEAAKPKPKRRNYKKELEQASLTIDLLKDQLLRKAAEFDNYRKRTEKDFAEHLRNANAQLITDLLPVLDDHDRAIATDTKSEDYESLRKGNELVRQKFFDVLKSYGLQPIQALDQQFDPEKHEALMQMEVKGKKPNLVVEEYLKGYELNGRVLRHAKVFVSK